MASARTTAPDRAPRTPTTAMLDRAVRVSVAGPPISRTEAPALAANCAARLAGAANATTDPSATDAVSSASDSVESVSGSKPTARPSSRTLRADLANAKTAAPAS